MVGKIATILLAAQVGCQVILKGWLHMLTVQVGLTGWPPRMDEQVGCTGWPYSWVGLPGWPPRLEAAQVGRTAGLAAQVE